MQKGPYYHQQQQQQQVRQQQPHGPQPRPNQMVYSQPQQQINQLPNLSNSHMQAPMQTGPRPTFGAAGPTDSHTIRPIAGPRMPMNAHYVGSPQEGGFGGHTPPQYHAYHVQTQNNMPFTSSYNPGGYMQPRAGAPGGYYVVPQNVVPHSTAYGNNVVIAPQAGGGGAAHQQQASQHHMQQSQQPQQQQQAPKPEQQQKKRPTIKLTDPNTGKDLTGELLAIKDAKTNAKPVVNPEENIKQKTAALFAAQVAKVVAGSAPPTEKAKAPTPPPPAEKSAPSAPIKISTPPPAKGSSAKTEVPAPKPTPVLSAPKPTPVLSAPPSTDKIAPKIVKSEAEVKTETDEKVTPAKTEKLVAEVETPAEKVVEPASPVELPAPEAEGTKVEANIAAGGKVRPICKVEDAALKKDVEMATELVDKMTTFNVQPTSEKTETVVEETKVQEPATVVVEETKVQEPATVVVEETIESVEVAATESTPEDNVTSSTEKKPVVENEESAKIENKNVKIEKNSEAAEAPPKKEKLEEQCSDAPASAPEVVEKSDENVSKKAEGTQDAVKKEEPVKAKEAPAPAPAVVVPAKPKVDAISRFAPSFSFAPPSMKATAPPKPKTEEVKKTDPVNGHDAAVKKKKGKSRFKDFDAKEQDDMLSAFVDAPEKAAPTPEPAQVAETPAEEMSWEDKDEKSIAKEDIRGEDAEDDAAAPKRVGTKILQGSAASAEERHQYDRDFLLKIQFEPICTTKPDYLTDNDIVLSEAHAPTKALVAGQSMPANAFIPTFMRQGSGGGNRAGGDRGGDRGDNRGGNDRGGDRSGSRNSRDNSKGGGGRGSQGNTSRAPKVISIPHLELGNLQLKRSENEWKRPSEQDKNLSTEEKEMKELTRNVQSILNKLTPQKFKPLVTQMMELKITNAKKLESAISLIFSKAISEPGFSVAYANMCRVLTDKFNSVPVDNTDGAATVTFRKLLLNKCQGEFEKEKDDEKLLEEERAKVFEKEEERKLHLEELNYKEMMNRRRTMGNIRFIGELYKLKMISEPIMHDCIFKLLKSDKQESLEEQLECLCKLLATIGKMMDHEKAKARMDQYFDRIQKIIDKKKTSSRIRFALKDVIDLRKDAWVPRRDEGAPKTIDQIHKEAQEKEKKEEIARQQDKLNKKLEPRGRRNDGGGGRDSQGGRGGGGRGGGGGGGGGGGAQSADGWNTVPNKSRPIQSAPVDAKKFTMFKKMDMSGALGGEMSLGPGLRPGAWTKGASGGGGSRSSSGTNTPTSDMDSTRSNRFGALTDNSAAPGSLSPKLGGFGRSNSGGGSRKGSQEGNRNNSRDNNRNNNPRSDGFRLGPRYDTGSNPHSRNQSPAPGSRGQSPARGIMGRNQSPAPSRDSARSVPPAPVAAAEPVSEEKMRKVTQSTMEEYLGLRDMKEAALCIKELKSTARHPVFVEEAVMLVLEKKPDNRKDAGRLIHHMIRAGILDAPSVCQGLVPVIEFAPDFAVDIPLIYKYLGEVLGPIVFDGTLPLNKVKDTLQPLVSSNKAGIVMAESLAVGVQLASEADVARVWHGSGVQWAELIDQDVEQFVKDRKMEFTNTNDNTNDNTNANTNDNNVAPEPSSSESETATAPKTETPPTNTAKSLQNDMLDILTRANETSKNNDLISFIEGHIEAADRKKADFIRTLTTAVCSSAIERTGPQQCECRTEVLKKRKTVLLKYIDCSKELELESLYALQELVEELEHPRDLLRVLFNELYQGDVISEETFFVWETSKESPVGKGSALSSVKDFLVWLGKAEEESNEEEETTATTPTNLA